MDQLPGRCSVGQLGLAAVWLSVLLQLHTAHASIIYRNAAADTVFVDKEASATFLTRSLLYNSWDFELVVKDNLERECIEEVCNYEEAREVFEDDKKTQAFWKTYTKDGHTTSVDVSGLVAGIVAFVVIAIIATVLGIYFYKNKNKDRRQTPQGPVRMAGDGGPAPEVVPLTGIIAPPLPSYNDALTRSGQHDAPPPPYSGDAPPEPTEPGDQ